MKYTPQLYYKITGMFRIKSLSRSFLYTSKGRGCLPHSKCSINIYWIDLVETMGAVKISFLNQFRNPLYAFPTAQPLAETCGISLLHYIVFFLVGRLKSLDSLSCFELKYFSFLTLLSALPVEFTYWKFPFSTWQGFKY